MAKNLLMMESASIKDKILFEEIAEISKHMWNKYKND